MHESVYMTFGKRQKQTVIDIKYVITWEGGRGKLSWTVVGYATSLIMIATQQCIFQNVWKCMLSKMNLVYTPYFIHTKKMVRKWLQSSKRDNSLESESKEVPIGRWGSPDKGKEATVLPFVLQNSLMMESGVVNLLLTGAMHCWGKKIIRTISPTQWERLEPRVGVPSSGGA